MASKEVKQLIERLREQGWRVDPTKGGHFRAFSPDGVHIVHIAGTPSSKRSHANTVALLRRYGYKGK